MVNKVILDINVFIQFVRKSAVKLKVAQKLFISYQANNNLIVNLMKTIHQIFNGNSPKQRKIKVNSNKVNLSIKLFSPLKL